MNIARRTPLSSRMARATGISSPLESLDRVLRTVEQSEVSVEQPELTGVLRGTYRMVNRNRQAVVTLFTSELYRPFIRFVTVLVEAPFRRGDGLLDEDRLPFRERCLFHRTSQIKRFDVPDTPAGESEYERVGCARAGFEPVFFL